MRVCNKTRVIYNGPRVYEKGSRAAAFASAAATIEIKNGQALTSGFLPTKPPTSFNQLPRSPASRDFEVGFICALDLRHHGGFIAMLSSLLRRVSPRAEKQGP